MDQTVEGSHRAHIGKETEFLTHRQQPRLRTDLRRRIIVETQVADSSEEHGVGLHTHLVGALRIRVAHSVDGVRTTDSLFVFKLVSALLSHSVEHSYTLFHNLGTNTIARENRNL